MTPTKGRSLDETEAPPLKVWRGGLIAQAKHAVHLKGKVAEESLSRAVYVRFFFSNKVKDKQEQVTHTSHLIEN